METRFAISLCALRLLRQCMEEAFSSPRLFAGQLCPRDWSEEWRICLECLDQTEGRVYHTVGDGSIILARVRRLLLVASQDDWSFLTVLEPGVVEVKAQVPDSSDWPAFHAQVGRYHRSDFEPAVMDLGDLRAAWDKAAADSLPYSSWFYTVQSLVEETFLIL